MVTDRMLHAHVFRTGGFMLRGTLKRIDGITVIDDNTHRHVDAMREICKQNRIKVPPIVAFIRNPWDWYVSQWCWVLHAKPGLRGSFRQYMESIKLMSSRDPNITTLTDNYFNYIGADQADYVGRFENLAEDTVSIIRTIMPDLATRGELFEIIATEPVHHPSAVWPFGERPGDYRQYYEDDTLHWVEKWDAALIKQFGYTF